MIGGNVMQGNGEQGTRVPEIRFGGFSEEWEVQKLEDLTRINQGLQIAISNRYTEKVDNSYFYITNEFLKNNSNIKYYIVNPPESVLCNKDDILMTRTGNTGEVVTNVAGAFHNNFFKIKFNVNLLNKDFFVCFLKLLKTQKIILQLAGSSTIPDLNHDAFYEIEIAFSSLNEQSKIGDFFQQIDRLIHQHQQKHDKLLNIKKALLEKMFPQPGKTKPEIRFKGFSGEWEEKELGDEVNFYSGLTYSPSNIVKGNGTLVLRSSNVKNGEIVDADNVFVDSEVINSENVKIGDVIVVVRNGSRALIGKHAQIKKEMSATVIGAFMTGIRANQSAFLNVLLDTSQFYKEVEKNLGATINQITTGAFKKMLFQFPSPEEQTKIGNFFQQLDRLISQHQTQIQKLNHLKQAFLSKMFV